MRKMIFICLAALFGFTACSDNFDDLNKELDGTWKTTSATNDGKEIQVVDSNITFNVSGSSAKIYGNAGVNSFNGKIKLSKRNLIAGDNIAMTRMMGDPVSQTFEDAFIDILFNPTDYQIKENKLIVINENTNSKLVFEKQN